MSWTPLWKISGIEISGNSKACPNWEREGDVCMTKFTSAWIVATLALGFKIFWAWWEMNLEAKAGHPIWVESFIKQVRKAHCGQVMDIFSRPSFIVTLLLVLRRLIRCDKNHSFSHPSWRVGHNIGDIFFLPPLILFIILRVIIFFISSFNNWAHTCEFVENCNKRFKMLNDK